MLIIADSAVIYMLPSVLELGLNSVMLTSFMLYNALDLSLYRAKSDA